MKVYGGHYLKDATRPIFVVYEPGNDFKMNKHGFCVITLNFEKGRYITDAEQEELFSLLTDYPPVMPLILEHNDADQQIENSLAALLDSTDIVYKISSFDTGVTTFNYSGKELDKILEAEERDIMETFEKKRAEVLQLYVEAYGTAAKIPAMKASIQDPANYTAVPTGFPALDQALDGGLYEGLYVLGAETGVGKTTFALQIMDSIAKRDHDVLIFSLEMPEYELMAKSMARLSYQHMLEAKDPFIMSKAVTSRGIMAGARYATYSNARKEVIDNGMNLYAELADHVFIVTDAGNLTFKDIGGISVKDVAERISTHINATGRRPVVLIDYLQILKPLNPRYTDKQNIDFAIHAFKAMTELYHIPIMIISSLNRASYKKKTTSAAFKESGNIEYSTSVLMALDWQNIGDEDFDDKTEGQKSPREMQINILKNRFGAKDISINYNYFAKYEYFLETSQPEAAPEQTAYKKLDNREWKQII